MEQHVKVTNTSTTACTNNGTQPVALRESHLSLCSAWRVSERLSTLVRNPPTWIQGEGVCAQGTITPNISGLGLPCPVINSPADLLCACQVFSSLRAAKKVVQDQQLRPLLMLHPDALPEFADVDCSSPNAVVLGLAQQAFTYDSMNTAFRLLLQQPEAPLIAIHKGKYYKASDGQLALGPGPYAAALEYATGRAAQVGHAFIQQVRPQQSMPVLVGVCLQCSH